MIDWNQVRTDEKARYLAANSHLEDSYARWRAYEDGILNRFGPPHTEPPERRVRALDYAWEKRDRFNTWVSNKTNKMAPRSEHGNGLERPTK